MVLCSRHALTQTLRCTDSGIMSAFRCGAMQSGQGQLSEQAGTQSLNEEVDNHEAESVNNAGSGSGSDFCAGGCPFPLLSVCR